MRESSGLIRWKRTESKAKKVRAPAFMREETPADAKRSRPATGMSLPRRGGVERETQDMCRTQARRLAITVVRNERDYMAYEVRRTEYVYDLAVVDTVTQRSYIVRTARELAELMTELHDPSLLAGGQGGAIIVKTPFYEEVRGFEEEYTNIARYTLIARFNPHDGSDRVDVMIEPEPSPGCDLDRMFLRVDNCLGAACGNALSEGEHDRSRLLTEASKRLRRYQEQHIA